MSPGVLSAEPGFTVTPMSKTEKEKPNFGAVIEDLDLESISGKFNVMVVYNDQRLTSLDADEKALAETIWTHKLVVVKGQKNLSPIKQWELVTRFDPEAPQVHSHGDVKTFHKQGGLLTVSNPGKVLTPSH